MRNLEVPIKYQNLYKIAMARKSLRAAIHCHCLMCVGWQYKEAVNCTATGCPLYAYRPGTGKPDPNQPQIMASIDAPLHPDGQGGVPERPEG